MKQIKTYSKFRPKSTIFQEKDCSIFEDEMKDAERADEDAECLKKRSKHYISPDFIRKTTMEKSKICKTKMKTVRCPKQLKSALKRKPLQMVDTNTRPVKKKAKDKSHVVQDTSMKKKKGFEWPADEEESIEQLRKDIGMTWQQKISFLLPKMNQQYSPEEEPHTKNGKPQQMSNPILDISAEEVQEVNDDEDETYTYTWVTATATNTGPSHLPCSRGNSERKYSEATLVPVNLSKGKTRKSGADVEKIECLFIERDKAGLSFNQQFNSTTHQNAKNIKDCGFPSEVSSIRLSTSSKKKTLLQNRQETTPLKQTTLLEPPSRPKKNKQKDNQLCSTKMFISDHCEFVDMVPEISTIHKGRPDDSIELGREHLPFVKICRTESPVTPFISPKKGDDQVYTSTPTKDKNKEKEFPEFDLSSVQLPDYEDEDVPLVPNESRVVNSQEIVCESLEEVPEPVLIIENKELNKQNSSEHADNTKNHAESTKTSETGTVICNGKDISRKHSTKGDNSHHNVSVIPINKSKETITLGKSQGHSSRNNSGKGQSQNHSCEAQEGLANKELEPCCIETFHLPLKPITTSKCNTECKKVLQNSAIDCIQKMICLSEY